MSPGGQAPWVSIKSLREDFAASEPIATMLPPRAALALEGPARWHSGMSRLSWVLVFLTVLFLHPYIPLFAVTNFLPCFHKVYCTEDLGLESFYPPQLSFGQLWTRIIHTLGKVGCGARGPASGIFYRSDKTPELDKNSWWAFLRATKPKTKPSL